MPLAPKKILIVEDEADIVQLVKLYLEKEGFHASIAQTGAEALMLMKSGRPDLLILDLMLPEMDGLDATRAIRHREASTGVHLPILAMTAHAMKGDRERCLDAGMDDYLMKPIRADQLFQALERIGVGTAPPAAGANEKAEPKSTDIVDWRTALQAVNQDEELLKQVVEAFLEECPRLIETMSDSMASAEWKIFQRAAHTLKSGLRMFGVLKLADDIEQLELSVKADGLRTNPPMMDIVVRRSQGILAEMTSYLRSTPINGGID